MFPACALFQALRQRGHDVTIVTDVRGNAFCSDISEKAVFDTIRFSYKNLLGVGFHSLLAALKFFKMWSGKRPDVIIGFGGVFTVVPMLIAKMLGSMIVLYEQNSVLGKANKFLERFSDMKLSSFSLDESWTIVPPIVRDEFIRNPAPKYECDGIIRILVIGGSRGAASFSEIIPRALETLTSPERENIEIVQQSGETDDLRKIYENLGVKAELKPFLNHVGEIMLNSQLVICRSGASTLSELSATGRPAVLIPYPSAADNHQFHNAMYYKNKKAAWILEEKDGIADELGKILRQFLNNRELLKEASSRIMNVSIYSATDNFAKLIEQIRRYD
jgi:UDP-N-acetylglucosamine--N-acetylmuramyl-(pentapeptide) pyrophosphoryl-undecaprenol N-acetylglucosamine transferase